MKKQNVSLLAFNEPGAQVTEAIRQVRTSVMLSSLGGPPVCLAVTSPNPNEGKTTIAVNIAASLAQNGRKVVLMDADLRRPVIHDIFQQSSQPGLSNYLTGSASFSQVLRSTEVPNLFFIPAGAIPPNPSELLDSKEFQDLLNKLKSEFQHLIIDTPPIIQFADGRTVAALMDGVLLVFKYQSTGREAGGLARQLLDQVNARVIGAVLNMATTDRLGYYTSYYYKNYYQHYYKSK